MCPPCPKNIGTSVTSVMFFEEKSAINSSRLGDINSKNASSTVKSGFSARINF